MRNLLQLSEQIATPLEAIASPQRIAILLAIGRGEACVCHLEALLGWRQAYISQHLMALRRAGILQDRRAGRFVFYRLRDASILDLIQLAASLSGIPAEAFSVPVSEPSHMGCECPSCRVQSNPNLISLTR